MLINEVMDGSVLVAIVGSFDDVPWGNKFVSDEKLPMQLGTLRVNRGIINNHLHKEKNIQFKSIACEFHYIVRGKALLNIFNMKGKLMDTMMLLPNMFCMLYNGGHGYEILKNDTLIIETKIGAYDGVQADKEYI